MPSIYYLNAPPHPFWDFVAGIEDHPFLAQYRRSGAPPPPPPEQAAAPAPGETTNATTSEKAKGKEPEANVEDPPEVDPTTVRPTARDMPFRGRGRFSHAFDDSDNEANKTPGEDGHRGKRGCHGPRHGPGGRGPWGHHRPGPPPFMFGPDFPFGPHGPFGGHPRGPPPPHGPFEGPHSGPPGPPPHGPFGDHEGHGPHGHHGHPGGFRGRGGPHRGRFGGHHGPHSRSPPHGGPFGRPGGPHGFDLGSFLNNLGERLGVDLSSAAEGLGLRQPRSPDSDFEPRTDIFDTATHYTIHLSLPGAKKSDVGVDWDGEHSALRIAGVVHRPGVDEEMMTRLVVDGRKRETGVFEKTIRLGTTKEPASINVEGITAKMVDGVLVVRVPKVEKHFSKKEVRVDGSASPVSRPEDAYLNEKDLLFDAADEEDKDMYDATSEAPATTENAKHVEAAAEKEKEAEAEASRHRDDRSETVGFETQPQPTIVTEPLPRYEVQEPAESKAAKEEEHHHDHDDEDESDWEKYGSEEEGEYVKINVD